MKTPKKRDMWYIEAKKLLYLNYEGTKMLEVMMYKRSKERNVDVLYTSYELSYEKNLLFKMS